MRPTRICPDIARWVIAAKPAATDLTLELIDLAKWPLPMDAEPGVPAWDASYKHDLTRAWSREIASASACVFVTPQYNWGYPAPLKNALDLLYREWIDKPAMVVSYGFHGGGKSAAQLRQVIEAMKMRVAATMPALTLPAAMKAGASVDVALASFAPEVASVVKAFSELKTLLTEAHAT